MRWSSRELRAKNAGSLLWMQGDLYDVAQGWRRVGGTQESGVQWAAFGNFDIAARSPREDLGSLVDSDGTKALLLEPGGRVVRELNRSWYCASAYRFPLVLLTLPSGETGVAYCPDNYSQIEIEVARTGERLTAHGKRQPADVFHSRLQVSPDGGSMASVDNQRTVEMPRGPPDHGRPIYVLRSMRAA